MSILETNLAIVERRNRELAALMRSDIDCRHVEVIPSHQPGIPTARVTLPSGEKVLLHNMEDPIGSAARSAERQEMKAENASILLGFGLGYLARELARKIEKKHALLICETDPAILKTAMRHVDLSDVLDSDYIRIVAGEGIEMHRWVHTLNMKFMNAKVDVISYGPAIRTNPDEYRHLLDITQKESLAVILNRNTILKAGQVMMDNVLCNFPDVLQSAGVKHLERLFQGRPAILVAAGPSLEQNVHLLRELQGRAVIIAVDTALRLLLPLGIKPDIVTTIDFNRINFQKFANVPIDADISLVYHPGGYYESIRAFHGPRFTVSQVPNRIPHWLMQFVEDKGSLASGTTVAHMSFHLACLLGCDPIVFVGQDLAFPAKKIHAGDLSLWRINTDEMETVDDIFGEPVGSMTSFRHAIHHFEKSFKETDATIIDATEAGAKKQGARPMRLRDVIDEYGRIAPLDIKGILRAASEQGEWVRMDDLLREMDAVSEGLNQIQKLCRQVMTVSRKMRKKIEAGEMGDGAFIKLSLEAERLTKAMDVYGSVLYLMGEQNYALELYMARHAVTAVDEIEDLNEKIRRQIERAHVYYPMVAGASARFKKPLDRLIRRLKRARELNMADPGSEANAEAWYERGLAISKIEYGQVAITMLREALARDPNHVPSLKLLIRLYLDANRLGEARDVMNRLTRAAKMDRRTNELAAELAAKEQAWTDRCARVTAEFKEKIRPDSLEEAGWFYYRTKDYARAIAKLEQAAGRRPTAEIYAKLGYARLKHGKMDGAVEAWEQALALDPKRADLYKELGELTLDQGFKEQAERFFQAALELEPDDAESCEKLARLYLERCAYLEAGLCYENILRLSPNRTELIPRIAVIYQRQIKMIGSTQ